MDAIKQILMWVLGTLSAFGILILVSEGKDRGDKSMTYLGYGILICAAILALLFGWN